MHDVLAVPPCGSGTRVSEIVRLVPADLRLVEAALTGDEALAEAIGCPVARGWATFAEALEAARLTLAADPGSVKWGPRLFIGGEPPQVVGWGGFKGPPARGVVELGYEIAADLRGRGLATAAAEAMVAEAFAHDDVTALIAHTLPEPNTSNRILDKLGFGHDGERTDHGNTVWRYVLRRPPDRSP